MSMQVTLADIERAREVLKPILTPTPMLLSPRLSEHLGCEAYLKLESMQPVGSFKIRGATYKIASLTAEEKARGVIAASAGNHSQGVAWGSKKLGVSSLIVMPTAASLTKVENTKRLGAEVILHGDNYDEAFAHATELAASSGRVFVHAFKDPKIIAGQGTLALEMLEQVPDLDWVSASIGGGGLMTGIATVFKAKRPQAIILASQSRGAPSMARSLAKHELQAPMPVNTLADGIAVARADAEMYAALEPLVSRVVEIDDEAIANSILTLMEKAKVMAEGSGAIALAAIETFKTEIQGKKIAIVLSGGNIDVNLLARIIDRGLIRAGRRLRVNVVVADRPGSLSRLTQTIAREGANILQAIHDRSEPSTAMDETDIQFTIETRGVDHSRRVVEALKREAVRLELAQ